jgi:hypothetical protein
MTSTMKTDCPECGRSATITLQEIPDGRGNVTHHFTLGCPTWHGASPAILRAIWEDAEH